MEDPYKYFKIEASEIMINLTKSLLGLDKKPDDQNLIKEIFRYAHTLKGASKVVRLPQISKLAHKMEDLLSTFRDQRKIASHDDITLLLDASTVMNNMVEAVKKGKPDNIVDCEAILKKLEKRDNILLNKEKEETPNQENPSLNECSENVSITSVDNIQENSSTSSDSSSISETIRISLDSMTKLTNLSNEILINNLRLKNLSENLWRFTRHLRKDIFLKNSNKQNLNEDYYKKLEQVVNEIEQGVNRDSFYSAEMNDIIMNTRLIAVINYAYYFEKAIRDLCVETGQKVDFMMQGSDLLLDRSVLEHIKEPIYHILRNGVIHGIESITERIDKGKNPSGYVVLKFKKIDEFIHISCMDDGRGLNPKKIKELSLKKKLIDQKTCDEISDENALYLILKSGFSSASNLTELAGRGVGMDIVKSKIVELGGNLNIDSKVDQYTKFTITLPLIMNIFDVFLISVSGHKLLLPVNKVVTTQILKENEIFFETGKRIILYNDSPISILNLSDILGLDTEKNIRNKKLKVIILKDNLGMVGLVVDDLLGKKTVLLRKLEGSLKNINFVNFAAILENGDPAFVLDISDIFEKIKGLKESLPFEEAPERPSPSILVVDDSLTTRSLIKGILEGEGYKVQLAQSAEDALALIEKMRFDLILTDVEMPGINGFELSHKIRQGKSHKDTPIVILTSLPSDSDKRRGISVGANAYIVKGSFEQQSFLETIESFVYI
ncbi:MAG: response regulator [Desulfobacterales bacterium]|nr:response regulator [Desulfobacterales bacterium]